MNNFTRNKAEEVQNRREAHTREMWVAIHANQTLAVEDYMQSSMDSIEVSAMSLHGPFSRFVFGLIDNTTDTRKILKLCMKADEIPLLRQEYMLAVLDKRAYKNKGGKASAEVSPAYTVQIKTGTLKGRTPADILLNDSEKLSELERTKTWLASNLTKYPGNQVIIDAIDEANYLLSIGKLTNAELSKNKNTCTIYEESFKVMSSGRPNSKLQCTGRIFCDYDADNPWCIAIDNWDIPFINGTFDTTKLGPKRSGCMYLNDKEMAALMEALIRGKTLFEQHTYESAYNWMHENAWAPDKKK